MDRENKDAFALGDGVASASGRLADGSPSATIAAGRPHSDAVKHFVLCNAKIILGCQDGWATAVTDDRVSKSTTPLSPMGFAPSAPPPVQVHGLLLHEPEVVEGLLDPPASRGAFRQLGDGFLD